MGEDESDPEPGAGGGAGLVPEGEHFAGGVVALAIDVAGRALGGTGERAVGDIRPGGGKLGELGTQAAQVEREGGEKGVLHHSVAGCESAADDLFESGPALRRAVPAVACPFAGCFAPDGRFHCMPTEDLTPAIELFRHRFLHALRETKLISPKKLTDLLSWKHCGFLIHDGAPDLDWLNRPRKPLHSQPGWL